MKKTFKLTHEKIKPARLVEKFKYEVKKYVKRERRRSLPKTMDYWDFNCRYGADADSAEVIHFSTINEHISKAEAAGYSEFYLEILAHAKQRNKHTPESTDEVNEFED